jgi:selenophosphate synthetase-related protein
MMAVDLRGAYRWEGSLCWNASVNSPAGRLQTDLRLLSELANEGLVTAGKDISNGGVPGTLAMLLATSQCGAILNLDTIPIPPGVDMLHWLVSFPSYGYLLSVCPEKAPEVRAKFQSRDIACEVIGEITPSANDASSHPITMQWHGATALFTHVTPAPYPM